MSVDTWRVSVAAQGLGQPLDTSGWTTGLRSLDLLAFKSGRGFKDAPATLTWNARRESAGEERVLLHYFSGWPHVSVRLFDGQHRRDLPLEASGSGRVPGEALWTAELPAGEFRRDWGFLLIGPEDRIDAPPGGGLYRPLGSSIYLADGEIFCRPPPAFRSAPRIESVHLEAPEMEPYVHGPLSPASRL